MNCWNFTTHPPHDETLCWQNATFQSLSGKVYIFSCGHDRVWCIQCKLLWKPHGKVVLLTHTSSHWSDYGRLRIVSFIQKKLLPLLVRIRQGDCDVPDNMLLSLVQGLKRNTVLMENIEGLINWQPVLSLSCESDDKKHHFPPWGDHRGCNDGYYQASSVSLSLSVVHPLSLGVRICV